ncbi:MAG: bifunctional phosphoglucose/phosphomannose isomerase [Candidatus Tectimicrobiota bacterium]
MEGILMGQAFAERCYAVDRAGMAQHLLRGPALAQPAYEAGRGLIGTQPPPALAHLVVAGMGGSAIGGDFLRDLAMGRCAVPIIPHRDFGLPAFVGPDSGVVAVSYSGETAETLSAFAEASARGTWRWVVATGGTLAERARAADVPAVIVPGGLPPRAAMGPLFFSLVGLAEGLGLFGAQTEAVEEVLGVWQTLNDRYRPEADEEANPALALARRLLEAVPSIYGASGLTEGVARRWKCQLNENSKMAASADVLPEVIHNEVASYELILSYPGPSRVVVLLEDPDDDPPVARRRAHLADWLEERGVAVERVAAKGQARLARLTALVVLGDWVSYYAAVLRGVDPTPIDSIEALKAQGNASDASP